MLLPSPFDTGNELRTKSRTLAGSFSRPRFARRSPRHFGFPSDAAALRLVEASAPATTSESTTAATADDVGAGASDDTADTSFGQSVGASANGTNNSPRATVCTRDQACSTQTPWRLRSAGFASVDSPIASHKIHVLSGRPPACQIVTPDAPLAQVRHTCALNTSCYPWTACCALRLRWKIRNLFVSLLIYLILRVKISA